MKKVSIIIPFYNCKYVDLAIESALRQTYKNIEVIVVDDGSTKYTEKISPYLSDIKYLQKSNGGTASALNVGIENATGEYFSWLSSDDLYKPGKISRQLSFMEEKNAVISFSSYSLINADGEDLGEVSSQFYNKIDFIRRFLRYCPVNGCTVLLKMGAFSEVGLFDETLRFANDYDLWCRMLLKYEFKYLDDHLVFYRQHSEMGTKRFANIIQNETETVKSRYQLHLRDKLKAELKKRAFE